MFVCTHPVLHDWVYGPWSGWTPVQAFVVDRVTEFLTTLSEDVLRKEFDLGSLDDDGSITLEVASTNVVCVFVLSGDRLDLFELQPELPNVEAAPLPG